jgi:hypothetical protein
MGEDWWPSEAIQELLKIASVPDSPTARAALGEDLTWASGIFEELSGEQKPIPRDLYEKTAAAAHKLLALMTELESQYWRYRRGHWLEDENAAKEEIKRIQVGAERAAQQRKPGRPERGDRLVIVVMAARFLEKHSTVKQSTYPNSTFAGFVERFWEVATGTSVESGDLETQIRQTVERTRAGKLWS